jgi:O-antigen/teichoic acid export membrane protein
MTVATTTTASSPVTVTPPKPTQPQPRSRHGAKAVAWNVIWNWLGIAITMGLGLILSRFLIIRLGEDVYGLWMVIAALTAYFGLMDLGIRGSVGRYIAYYRAQHDPEEVNRVLNTSLVALCGVGAAIAVATLIAVWVFPHFFTAPPGLEKTARIALLIVGLNLALTFPFAIFDSVLWAMQRFDLLNLIDIPVGILRTALAFYFIGRGDGLLALAVIAISTSALAAIIKAVLSFWIEPQLRLHVRCSSLATAKMIYGYGVWSFLLAAAREGRDKLSPILIGSLLNLNLVTVFSIAARLIGIATQFVVASTGVLTPVSTALHAQEKNDKQQRLFVEGGKYCTAISLFFLLFFFVLGKSVILLWMGAKGPQIVDEGAARLLDVLVIGEVIPMSQWVTYSMILGMARHKLSAVLAVVEVALMVGLMVALVHPMGLMGICIAVAIAGTLCRGVFQILYGCHLIRLSLWRYTIEALLRPVVLAAPTGVVLYLVAQRYPADTWIKLAAYGLVFSLVYFGGALVLLGGADQVRAYLSRKRAERAAAEIADASEASIDAVAGV